MPPKDCIGEEMVGSRGRDGSAKPRRLSKRSCATSSLQPPDGRVVAEKGASSGCRGWSQVAGDDGVSGGRRWSLLLAIIVAGDDGVTGEETPLGNAVAGAPDHASGIDFGVMSR
ncbi:hypothetical protein L2E82_06519 [Cichorium intybus]|uniref:Uncharacterized protein n=1 Tax=Cichorium intybus TaxID=13427 RepID=A0ACB9HAQ3_CICIN|nr:hypothetical protein L2E82_06519 [Cichorium intybus]